MSVDVQGLEELTLRVDSFAYDALASGPSGGQLVLLLHGWPQFADSWAPLLRSLGAAGYRAIAVDQRGYSPGARPDDVAAYGIGALTGDVLSFADQLGAKRFHLVSHDWGAIVGWHLASDRPERLLSFTTLATPHLAALAEARASDPDQQARSAYIGIFRLPGGVAERTLLADDAAKLRAVYQGKPSPEQIVNNVRRLTEPGALTAVLNWYRAYEFVTLPGPVSVPTLYLWGTDDLALGERAARGTAAHVTGPYRFEALAGTSHWIVDEIPERVASEVLAHLGTYGATASA